MKTIKSITDMDILGKEGISCAAPRKTARAIIKNALGEYAVIHSEEFDLYSLAGGGIEEGESIETALRREVAEETGCNILSIKELGIIEENRAYCDYTQISYYFYITTDSTELSQTLTNDEQKHGTSALWMSFDDMYKAIAEPIHPTAQRKFLQARDVAALDEYIRIKSDKSP